MSHLVLEGYADVADCFEGETLLKADRPSVSIEERMGIRKAVLNGDIAGALEQCNALYPDLFDSPRHSSLFFLLQQQRLIELIRTGQVTAAIQFARSDLAPRAQHQPSFLAELERIMSLLAFESPATQSPYGYLLSQQQRQAVASQFNLALLAQQQSSSTAQHTQHRSQLVNCLQALHRMQATLATSHHIPTLTLIAHTVTPSAADGTATASAPPTTVPPPSPAPTSTTSSSLFRRSSMPANVVASSASSSAAGGGSRSQRPRGRGSVGGAGAGGSSAAGGGGLSSSANSSEDYEMV